VGVRRRQGVYRRPMTISTPRNFTPNTTFAETRNQPLLSFQITTLPTSRPTKIMIRVNRANSGTGGATLGLAGKECWRPNSTPGIAKAGVSQLRPRTSAPAQHTRRHRQHIIRVQGDVYDLWIVTPPHFGANELDIPPPVSVGALTLTACRFERAVGPICVGSLNAEFDEFRVATTWSKPPWFGHASAPCGSHQLYERHAKRRFPPRSGPLRSAPHRHFSGNGVPMPAARGVTFPARRPRFTQLRTWRSPRVGSGIA
jgi:hypothetical protein